MDELPSLGRMFGSLGGWDGLVLAVSLAALFVIAALAGRKESNTRDFFLGARRVPVIVATLSFIATEVSAVTITNVPGTGFTENLQYLQFFIGSAASKLFVAFLFLPVFYKHDCTSIYEFLQARFGPPSQYCGSIFFFITRLMSAGIRLYAACFAIACIMGWTLGQSLLLFTVVSIAFIAFGGIKAVVWAGAYQATVFYLAGAAVVAWIFLHITGGLQQVWDLAGPAGRLSVFKFDFHLNNPTTFWAGTANAFFVGLAMFGTDQELVQRLLTVRTRRDSQKAMVWTILAAFPVVLLYLLIGTLMFVFFAQRPDPAVPSAAKEVFPYFITHYLPVGLKGLILAAIVLASIDSPLASLSSSFVVDIYRPLVRKAASEKHYLLVSRAGVVGFGLILAAIAWSCQRADNILWLAFRAVSVPAGSMLGVFLLGLLTRRGSNRGNIIAMTANAVLMAALLLACSFGPVGLASFLGFSNQAPPPGEPALIGLAWSWLIVIGTGFTFLLAYVIGLIPVNKAARGLDYDEAF